MADSVPLSVAEQVRRAKVRARLYQSYKQVADKGSFSPHGIKVEEALEALICIAQRPPSDGAEAYQADLMEDVCSACPNQQFSGYCPMRAAKQCQLFGNVVNVMETIRAALSEVDQSFENQPFDCHGFRRHASAD